jgi:hypothetical protein
MDLNIHELAKEALAVTEAEGLLDCVVESEIHRILAYRFDTPAHARTFRDQSRQRWMLANRPTVVLAYEG